MLSSRRPSHGSPLSESGRSFPQASPARANPGLVPLLLRRLALFLGFLLQAGLVGEGPAALACLAAAAAAKLVMLRCGTFLSAAWACGVELPGLTILLLLPLRQILGVSVAFLPVPDQVPLPALFQVIIDETLSRSFSRRRRR